MKKNDNSRLQLRRRKWRTNESTNESIHESMRIKCLAVINEGAPHWHWAAGSLGRAMMQRCWTSALELPWVEQWVQGWISLEMLKMLKMLHKMLQIISNPKLKTAISVVLRTTHIFEFSFRCEGWEGTSYVGHSILVRIPT